MRPAKLHAALLIAAGLFGAAAAPALAEKDKRRVGTERAAPTANTTGATLKINLLEKKRAAQRNAMIRAADDAYDRGDYSSAMRSWQGLAKGGNGLAAYHIGRLYRSGKGVTANPRRALRWFRQAARNRVGGAHYQIGMMYLTGEHVGRDIAEAWARFKVATRMGYPRARAALAYVSRYMDGLELWRARQRAAELWPKPVTAER